MQEFIARNGLIAQDNSIITGSLTTTDYIQAGFSPLFNNTGSRLSSDGTVNLLFSTTGNNSSGLSIGRAADNGTSIILRRGRFNATAIGVEGSAGSNNNSGVTTFSYYYQANPVSGINDGAFIELMRLNPPGYGNAILDVSGSARFGGNTTVTGSLNVTAGITGSLFGTAATASYVISSSYASTASYVANASSFPYTGSAVITGSLVITGSTTSIGGFTGSLFGTASYATTASYANNSTSASYANNSTSASYSNSSTSASYALTSATASYIQALSGYTTASRTLTINGVSYDLTADRSWTVPLSGSVRTIQKFIATAGQTSFTISGGYVAGLVDVYINGVKLDNNGDFTATNGTTVVLTVGAMLNDIVEVYNYISAFTANNTLRVVTPFTATAAQTTFSASYTPGFIDVFYNGSKLAASEYTASNGVSITLGTAAQLNDIVEVTAYSYTVGAFTGIGGSGTANYVTKFISGSTVGTSSIYDSGSNVGINTTNPIYTLDVSGSARFTNSATITGSLNISGSNTLIGTKTITGSVFISGSKTVIGTNTITGSLNVSGSITSTGTLTAQTLVVQTITSSVLYSSGSNIFGNSLSNTQVMTGSVGITGSLAVAGTGTFSGQINSEVGNNGILLRANTATTGYQYIDIINTGGRTQLIHEGSTAGATVTNSTAYASMFGSAYSKDLILFTNGAARVTISGSTGNVGIGTTSPSAILHLSSTGRVFQWSGATTGTQYFDGANSGANLVWGMEGSAGGILYTNSLPYAAVFGNENNYPVQFATNGITRMTISGSGNVGIGTAISLSSKLVVNGSLSVGNGWGVSGATLDIFPDATGSNGVTLAASYWSGTYGPIILSTSNTPRLTIASGGAATFSGDVIINKPSATTALRLNTTSATYQATIYLQEAGASKWEFGKASTTPNFDFYSYGTSSTVLSLNYSTGGATFSGTVSAGTQYNIANVGGKISGEGGATNYLGFYKDDGTAILKVVSNGNGYVYIGDGFSNSNHRINRKVAETGTILCISAYDTAANDTAYFYSVAGTSPNGAATAIGVMRNSSTSRSINASGTINASGADYAGYMTKIVDDVINKGDIVGVNTDGKLTNIFNDAKSFVVKSTDPSYVGGDVWGNEDTIGKKPQQTTDQTDEEFALIQAAFEAKLETARAKVDRISFSGQVPCNVTGATVGDYIIPIQLENGKIGGQAVTNPTFEQYQISVGKVWKIMEDGRAWIAVKIG